eukprot:gene4088-4471_t
MSRFRNVLGNVSFNKWKPKLSIVPVNDDERISGEDDSSVVSSTDGEDWMLPMILHN